MSKVPYLTTNPNSIGEACLTRLGAQLTVQSAHITRPTWECNTTASPSLDQTFIMDIDAKELLTPALINETCDFLV